MKRIDRAMYAIFLLVLLADVARAHASVPVGSDAGLILSAASQIQVSQGGEAIRVLRRSDGPLQSARFERFVSKFSRWSNHLSSLGNPVLSGTVALGFDARSVACSAPHDQSAISSLAIFAHGGSPAP
jgi:hypothetical protein